MLQNKLLTQPYKGARDFYPQDMQVENYIFDTWRKVCKSFGFEEYSFPIIEPFEIFASKTGEEIVNEQLYSFEDKGGRKIAIRPELTPGTVRMIAQKYKETPQPIKWFMIGNNWRYEKPQTGRGREFYQLEANIFGVSGVEADFEIFQLIVAIMRAFSAKEEMYQIKVSDRRLVNALLNEVLKLNTEVQSKVRRLMDKREKLSAEDFTASLTDLGLSESQIREVEQFMSSDFEGLNIPKGNAGYQALQKLFGYLKDVGIDGSVKFDAAIIRGFDYSDGLVYEVFDNNPNNRRSIFGGERFDKLINIFGDYELPSTGFAMGDYTLLEFLTGWNLLPQFKSEVDYLVTVWPSDDSKFLLKSLEVAEKLRAQGKNVVCWLDTGTKLEKQLKYADKKGIPQVVIIGEEELEKGVMTVKNLNTGKQKTLELDDSAID
ncbi:MAG: histidine--tRNA ligase [Patescibacteria group bacterium]